jgi:ABC-2 type transport system permease protein
MTARTDSAPADTAPADGSEVATAFRLGLARGGIELKQFFRQRQSMVFIFLFPLIILLIFSVIFSGKDQHTGIAYNKLLAAGIVGSGIMTSGFQSLAIQVSFDRDLGVLKRLYGGPMPKVSYFIGKQVMVIVSSVVQTAILLGVGKALTGINLPHGLYGWVTFLWIFVLGSVGCSLLGLAFSSVPKNGDSAPAVVTPPVLILQFISGVYIAYSQIPHWLYNNVAALFPLKWMCQGMRSVLLPDSFKSAEAAGSWEHGRTALILGAWVIAGLLLCVRTFRWQRARDR